MKRYQKTEEEITKDKILLIFDNKKQILSLEEIFSNLNQFWYDYHVKGKDYILEKLRKKYSNIKDFKVDDIQARTEAASVWTLIYNKLRNLYPGERTTIKTEELYFLIKEVPKEKTVIEPYSDEIKYEIISILGDTVQIERIRKPINMFQEYYIDFRRDYLIRDITDKAIRPYYHLYAIKKGLSEEEKENRINKLVNKLWKSNVNTIITIGEDYYRKFLDLFQEMKGRQVDTEDRKIEQLDLPGVNPDSENEQDNRNYNKNEKNATRSVWWIKEGYKANIIDYLAGRIHKTFTIVADDLYEKGFINRDQRIKLSNIIGDCLDLFDEKVKGELKELENKKIY